MNYLNADLTPRQRAMLDFAVKVAERSHQWSATTDFAALRQHGRPTTDIWDIGVDYGAVRASNRVANLLAPRAERRVLHDGPLGPGDTQV